MLPKYHFLQRIIHRLCLEDQDLFPTLVTQNSKLSISNNCTHTPTAARAAVRISGPMGGFQEWSSRRDGLPSLAGQPFCAPHRGGSGWLLWCAISLLRLGHQHAVHCGEGQSGQGGRQSSGPLIQQMRYAKLSSGDGQRTS